MPNVSKYGWLGGAAVGLVLGLFLAGLWPEAPLHASATDRSDKFALATGLVDDGVEAVYYLDFMTGRLAGAVLSRQAKAWQANFGADLAGDLARVIRTKNSENMRTGRPQISMPTSPNWLLVTGENDIRVTGGSRERPSRSTVYVAETSTGIVMAYVVPWAVEKHSSGMIHQTQMSLWAAEQFTSAVSRN